MNDAASSLWGWAADERRGMWCVTFTRGITPDDVLARYGADPSTADVLTLQQTARRYGSSQVEGSTLRVGALGDWAFCCEDYGVMGAMPGPLSALSQGTETFSVLRNGDGTNRFAHWRDGRRTERFEPGGTSTRPHPPHPWWDAVQERLEDEGETYRGLVPVLEAVAHHTKAVLDTDTLNGPLPTLFLAEASRTPDPPPPPRPGAARPPGRALGPALPGPATLPAAETGRATNISGGHPPDSDQQG